MVATLGNHFQGSKNAYKYYLVRKQEIRGEMFLYLYVEVDVAGASHSLARQLIGTTPPPPPPPPLPEKAHRTLGRWWPGAGLKNVFK